MIKEDFYKKPLWLEFLPGFLKKKIANRPNLQKIVSNINWLFFDKALRMGVGLFVGVWVARYLGPSDYGLLNFAIAFTALFGAFAVLGLDGIVIREIVKYPKLTNEILGSSFGLKLIGGVIAFIISLIAIFLLRPNEPLTIVLVALIAGGFIFQSINVIDLYFQSQVESKYTVYAQNSAFIIIAIVKIILILSKASLIVFAAVGLIEIILASLFLIIAYTYNHQSIKNWVFRKNRAKELLKDSWPLFLSGIAIIIYMRIDQVMLGQMLDEYSVGIYSAAVRISTVWYFVPMLVVNSVYPLIIKLQGSNKDLYYARLQKLFTLLVWMSIAIGLTITFMAKFIIIKLYGLPYAFSADVLIIHIWAGVFVSLGVVSGKWLLLENLQRYSFYRTLAGAVSNIILNLWLIPKYGVKGAAFATLMSQFVAAYCFDAFVPIMRRIFIMKTKSFFWAGLLR